MSNMMMNLHQGHPASAAPQSLVGCAMGAAGVAATAAGIAAAVADQSLGWADQSSAVSVKPGAGASADH